MQNMNTPNQTTAAGAAEAIAREYAERLAPDCLLSTRSLTEYLLDLLQAAAIQRGDGQTPRSTADSLELEAQWIRDYFQSYDLPFSIEFSLHMERAIAYGRQAMLTEMRSAPRAVAKSEADQSTCPVCDGGHGNDCACSCPPPHGEPTDLRKVIAEIRDRVQGDEDFSADEIVELCNKHLPRFSFSKEWCMAAAAKEEGQCDTSPPAAKSHSDWPVMRCEKCGCRMELSSGWVPTPQDPDNGGMAPMAEPYCPKCDTTRPADEPCAQPAETSGATPEDEGDFLGRDAFFAWHDKIWPEPKGSRQQKSNWQYRKNIAYDAWMAAERHCETRITNAEISAGLQYAENKELRELAAVRKSAGAGAAEHCLAEIRALMPKEWKDMELVWCVIQLKNSAKSTPENGGRS